MGVEQVRVGAAALVLRFARWTRIAGAPQHPVGVVAVEQPRPQPDLPGLAPARAAVAAKLQRVLHRRRQVGVSSGVIWSPVEANQVRHVAVLWLRVVPVEIPLLQVAAAADLVGRQPIQLRFDRRSELRVDAQRVRGLNHVEEQPADERKIGGRHHRDDARIAVRRRERVFGRRGGRRKGGQRICTLLIYLNDVHEGGETTFPKIDLKISPKKGAAIYFHYSNHIGQTDRQSLHRSVPVLNDEKWVATKWIRQGKIDK